MAISPDSRQLALGDDKGIIRFVDLESGGERRQVNSDGIDDTAQTFTPELDLTEIIAGYADGTIRIWPAPLEN